MSDAPYLPTGVCAGCFYRPDCHDARQHATDRQGLGAVRDCEFFREHERGRLRMREQMTQQLLREAGRRPT